MLYIVGGRCSGKTRMLLELSSEYRIPIMVKNERLSNDIQRYAASIGKLIPKPVTEAQVKQCGIPRERRTSLKRPLSPVLVDDICSYFAQMGLEPAVVTIDPAEVEIKEKPTLLNCLRVYLRYRKGGK